MWMVSCPASSPATSVLATVPMNEPALVLPNQEPSARVRKSAVSGVVDIGELLRRTDGCYVAVAADLRDGRAHDPGLRDLLADRCQGVTGGRRVEKLSSHAVQAVLEGNEERCRRTVVEQWYG